MSEINFRFTQSLLTFSTNAQPFFDKLWPQTSLLVGRHRKLLAVPRLLVELRWDEQLDVPQPERDVRQRDGDGARWGERKADGQRRRPGTNQNFRRQQHAASEGRDLSKTDNSVGSNSILKPKNFDNEAQTDL